MKGEIKEVQIRTMLKKIKENWSSLADELAGNKIYWKKSPSSQVLYEITEYALKKYCKGIALDVGAGRLSYKELILKYAEEYKSSDFKKTNQNLDYVVDAQDMKGIKANQFDTVFCSQVLEHIPEPQKALNEMNRVLKKDGKAIITVPFLGYLHNEPHDFFRYTKHSLRFMSKKAGFEVLELKEVGGLFTFLGYVWSTLFVGLLAPVPVLGKCAFYLNSWINYAWIGLDKITSNKKVMPLNYLLVLKKK